MKKGVLFLCQNRMDFLSALFCVFFQLTYSQDLNINRNSTISNTNKATILEVICPGDIVVSCDQDVQSVFNNWLNSFGYTGGGNVITTDLSDYVPPQPGELLEVIYMASDINNFDYCKGRFRVLNCNAAFCTYTQGFYGNCNGKACTVNLGEVNAQEIMKYAILKHGGEYNFGSVVTGNYFKLTSNDIFGHPNKCSNAIFKLLPGGGTANSLSGFSTYNTFSAWSDNNPLQAYGFYAGRINNVLLSQTITLFFNLSLSSELNDFEMQTNFSTAATTFCGSNVPILSSIQEFEIHSSIINYLNANCGGATVKNLFILANKALGNENIGNLSIAKINEAVDAINRGFDKCRIKVNAQSQELLKTSPIELKTTDYVVSPIPFNDFITVKYLLEDNSNVNFQIYDYNGSLLFEIEDHEVYQYKEFKINLPILFKNKDVLYLRISSKNSSVVKPIISK